jgi:hypothetical protein
MEAVCYSETFVTSIKIALYPNPQHYNLCDVRYSTFSIISSKYYVLGRFRNYRCSSINDTFVFLKRVAEDEVA